MALFFIHCLWSIVSLTSLRKLGVYHELSLVHKSFSASRDLNQFVCSFIDFIVHSVVVRLILNSWFESKFKFAYRRSCHRLRISHLSCALKSLIDCIFYSKYTFVVDPLNDAYLCVEVTITCINLSIKVVFLLKLQYRSLQRIFNHDEQKIKRK